jgi:dCTP diphosphatase
MRHCKDRLNTHIPIIIQQAVSMKTPSLSQLQQQLREFARERDWEQFHSPKNLSMALTVEAGELQEIFQWLTGDQSRHLSSEQLDMAAEEMADVLLYLCRLADVLDIDLLAAASAKLVKNAQKYPADEVRGSAQKR